MKRYLLILMAILLIAAPIFAQDIQKSSKKTLFVFPIQYGPNAQGITVDQKNWNTDEFYETFVKTFERFDFIEVRSTKSVDDFLANSKDYIEAHAQEMVQRRKEPNGRIGEVMVTINDLIQATEEAYVFVPQFNTIKQVKNKDDDGNVDIDHEVDAEITIYKVDNGEVITTIKANTKGLAGLVGGFASIVKKSAKNKVIENYRSAVRGVYQVMKTDIRKHHVFELKAMVTTYTGGSFTFDLGKDFGVRMDARYQVVVYNSSGKYSRQAFGKVRKVDGSQSKAQLLLGGDITEGDQVKELAAIGLNITPLVGIQTLKLEGFDFYSDWGIEDIPEDSDGAKAWIGVAFEYNTAQFTNMSETYAIVEAGVLPVEYAGIYTASFGIQKKVYMRNLALFGTVKAGVLHFEFSEYESDDDDKYNIINLGLEVGGELMLSPNFAVQGRIGVNLAPETPVIDADDDDYDATISGTGISIKVGAVITL